jgi:hypothetical protein
MGIASWARGGLGNRSPRAALITALAEHMTCASAAGDLTARASRTMPSGGSSTLLPGETAETSPVVDLAIQRVPSSRPDVVLNLHFHAIVLDGVFTRAEDATARFHDTGTPPQGSLPLSEGWFAFTPGRSRYRLGGNLAGGFWYAVNLHRGAKPTGPSEPAL